MRTTDRIEDPVVGPCTTQQILNTQHVEDISSAIDIEPALPGQQADTNVTKRCPTIRRRNAHQLRTAMLALLSKRGKPIVLFVYILFCAVSWCLKATNVSAQVNIVSSEELCGSPVWRCCYMRETSTVDIGRMGMAASLYEMCRLRR